MDLFTGARPDSGFPLLDELPWAAEGGQVALQAAERLLADSLLPKALAAWLTAQPEKMLDQISEKSLERTTHFKWFLGGLPGTYMVWIHEYKPPDAFARAADFAASVHNHRYGFCSRILSGALHVSDFSIRGADERIRVRGTRILYQGNTMILTPEDVHRVDRVGRHTYTLVVQGPAARNFSTWYEIDSNRWHRVYDLHSKLPQAIEFLTSKTQDAVSVS